MLDLDTNTVILSLSVLNICIGSTFLAFHERSNAIRIHLCGAMVSYGCAGLLIGFRDFLPPWFANVFANMVVGLSVVLIHRGTWIMVGKTPPDRVYLVSVLALGAIYYQFTYPFPHAGIRLLAVSLFRIPYFVSTAVALRSSRQLRSFWGVKALIWLLFTGACWYLFRGCISIATSELAALFRTGSMQSINFFIISILNILIALAFSRVDAEQAIAERNLAEAVLRESEKRLNRAELASMSGNWELHLDSRKIISSEGAAKLYGVDNNQLEYEDIKKIPLPEYRPLLDLSLKNLIENDEPYEVEFKIKTVDTGEIKDIHSIALFDKEKRIVFGIIQDVTERKRMEDAMRERDETYRVLFRNNHSVMLLVDPITGSIVDANAAAVSFSGYPYEELLNLKITDINIMTPEQIMVELQRVKSGDKNHFNFRHRLADGQTVDVVVYSSLIQFGGRQLLFSIINDETDRRQAEEKLIQSEKRYRSLFDNMLHGFAYCRMLFEDGHPDDFVYIDVNNAFETLTGLKNVIGKKVSEVIPGILITDPGVIESYGRVVITGNPEKFEIYLEALNAWLNVSVYSPEKEYFVAVFDVITERKRMEIELRESEQFVRATLDSLSSHICILDAKGTIVATNHAWNEFAKANQCEIQKGFEGVNYLRICEEAQGHDAGNALAVAEGIRAVMRSSKPLFEFEYPCDSPEGRRWFLGRVTRFLRGNFASVIVSHENITDRKSMEEERIALDRKSRMVMKAESLERMAGSIAHHFNNLLGAVIGNLELAIEDLPPELNIGNNLSEALKAAIRSTEVSRLMLTYLGKMYDKNKPMDLSETCQQSLPILRAVMPKNVTIVDELPSPGPIIKTNPQQIQQVLTHLLTNAWEACGESSGTIHLTIKTVSRADVPEMRHYPVDWQPLDNPYACLEVGDTGCGIDENNLEKIFDPFFSTKFTGRGLGLSVVLGIAKAHHGAVMVETELCHGSIFRIFFPVTTEEIPRHPVKASQYAEIREEGGTMLLIEDERLVRSMAAMMLDHLGYDVLEAGDGVEALEIFQQHRGEIDCVLSDLTMPRMNGWDTLHALRKLSPDIPVILCSGYNEDQVMAGDHAERPNAFLGKPYRLKELEEMIHRILADKR